MQVIITQDFQQSSLRVAQQFSKLLQQKPNAKLGLATGGSAEGVYACLVAAYQKKEIDFSQASSVNLDEYVGLASSHQQSYRYYMNHHLFDHINIDKQNTYIPNGMGPPQQELEIFQQKLESGTDLQLLGVGANGHIGFNEPSAKLIANAHIENLVESTISANSRYFSSTAEVPRQAFTQGMGDILKSRQIVLIATGSAKAQAIGQLLGHDKIDPMCPVTLLKLHPDVTVVIDQDLATAAQVPSQAS